MKRRRPRDAKLRILYCDDDPQLIDAFRERQVDNFHVESCTDIERVYHEIASRTDAELPDVLLLDLYHPHTSRATPDELAAHRRAKEKLDELSAMIREVRDHVDRAWSASAVDVLEELRSDYPEHKLPVMIYTQRGLLLLNDGELRRIEEAGAEWLLKDKDRISVATEAAWIRRYVRQANGERRIPRDLWVAASSVVASAVLGALVAFLVT